jgi:hypothetical protein
MRLRAAPDLSWFDRITIAADPIKQPYWFSVSKSAECRHRCQFTGRAAVGIERVSFSMRRNIRQLAL